MTPMFQLIVGMFFTVLLATETWEPARLQSGDLPPQPPMVGGGGEVLLEVAIDDTGRVSDAAVLRSTPPFTAPLREAVLGWRFTPAREAVEDTTRLEAVESKVLVAAVYRPPTLYDAPARGGVPRDEAPASEETPFPTAIEPPLYPPLAQTYIGQAVLVEAFIDEEGGVTECRVVRSAVGDPRPEVGLLGEHTSSSPPRNSFQETPTVKVEAYRYTASMEAEILATG